MEMEALKAKMARPSTSSATRAELEKVKEKAARAEREVGKLRKREARGRSIVAIRKGVAALRERFAQSHTLDVALVMDCTGSMGPWMTEAKEKLIKITTDAQEAVSGTAAAAGKAAAAGGGSRGSSSSRGGGGGSRAPRVAFVGYRDHSDGEKRLEVCPLTSDIESVRSFIRPLRAFGGGDGPEDVAGGLQAAMGLKWRQQGTCCVVLVCDAPCHGNRYHDGSGDSYGGGDPKGLDVEAQMAEFAHRGIDVTVLQIGNYPKKMVGMLRSAFRAVGRTDLPFQVVPLRSEDSVLLAPSVSTALAVSMSRSKMRMTTGAAAAGRGGFLGPTTAALRSMAPGPAVAGGESKAGALGPLLEVDPALTWSVFLDSSPVDVTASRLTMHFVDRGGDIDWKRVRLRETTQPATVAVSATPFAEGAMRFAFHMRDAVLGRMVAKCAKTARRDEKADHIADAQTQAVSKRLALEFNLLGVPRAVDFLPSTMYRLLPDGAAAAAASGGEEEVWYAAEPFLAGDYVKYTNNESYLAKGGEMHDVAQAFSHFSWWHTSGYLMVVDLQGVNNVFTDPQIHCTDGTRFGRGNLGSAGMCCFFDAHECNDICRALGLPHPVADKGRDWLAIANDAPGTAVGPAGDATPYTLCCGLCATHVSLTLSKLRRQTAKGREVYCDPCTAKMATSIDTTDCRVCRKPFRFTKFWYYFKGVPEPTTCKKHS